MHNTRLEMQPQLGHLQEKVDCLIQCVEEKREMGLGLGLGVQSEMGKSLHSSGSTDGLSKWIGLVLTDRLLSPFLGDRPTPMGLTKVRFG